MTKYNTVSERVKVPHDPLYIEYWDRQAYIDEMDYRFYTLIDTHRAWLAMFVEQGITPLADAAPVLAALKELKAGGPEMLPFQPPIFDVYTRMEVWLKERAGAERVAHLSLGRTRPEPLFRMRFREYLLDALDRLMDFRVTLFAVAERFSDAIMPGYTHQQHGQPTTFGAYLLALQDPLERTAAWLEMAYKTDNESTMGCGALSGTGFPIDRYRVADLLGFDGIMESTYASVSTGDHLIQAVTAAADAMVTVSRMCIDLEMWTNTEAQFVEIAPQFADVSSLMPQKKNPAIFEIVRTKSAHAIGDTTSVLAGLLKAPYMDTLELKVSFKPTLRVLENMTATMKLLCGLIGTLEFNRERALASAARGFSTASELVDEIYRQKGIPHRLAHSVVANLVTRALADGRSATDITPAIIDEVAQEVLGRTLSLTVEQVRRALDPTAFVASHDLPGGPAQSEVLRMIGVRRERLAKERERQCQRRERLARAGKLLDEVTGAMIGGN